VAVSDTQMVEFRYSIIDDRFGAFRRGQRTVLPKAIAWRWEAAGCVRLVDADVPPPLNEPLRGLRTIDNALVRRPDMNDALRHMVGAAMNATIVRGPEPRFSPHGQGMSRPSHCDRAASPFPGYRNG
jgi:hypothetical protein